MSFVHQNYILFILAGFIFYGFLFWYQQKKFFKALNDYFFKRRSIQYYISNIFFLLFILLFLMSLLDLRGPEEKIKQKISAERTIILIDTSASMLAEDVRPSRLQKAILIAKHFARKSAGQQLSIVVFSEIQKKIVPFTNDLDLIDARLESLKNLRNQYGGSALSTAIAESLQYFKETDENAKGNILVITDGEETVDGLDITPPSGNKIAFVGIGTAQGGKIPLDDGRGFRFGYKMSKGVEVVSRLNEDFFIRITKNNSQMKYWLANTYNLPSDEIVQFFKGRLDKKETQQDISIKPVLSHLILIPAILSLIFSVILKYLRPFIALSLIFCHLSYGAEKKRDPEIEVLLQKLASGQHDETIKLRLAQKFSESGEHQQAQQLYSEVESEKKLTEAAKVNMVTNLLQAKEDKKALNALKSIKVSELSQKEKEILFKNTLVYHQPKKSDQKEKKDQKNDQKNQDNKQEKGQQGSQKDNTDGSNNKDQKKQQKGEQGPDKNKKETEKSDEKNSDETKDNQPKPQSQPTKPMPSKVLPAKLKQLMSDDRQLQMKMIENGTRDLNKRHGGTKKDW